MERRGYRVVAVMFSGEQEVARFSTLKQAERNLRAYVWHLIRPVKKRREEGARGSCGLTELRACADR